VSTKADYNAEEWTLVVQAPALAGMRVIAADRGGTVRESVSMGRVYQEARAEAGDGLLAEIVAAPPGFEPGRGRELLEQLPDQLRRAVGILEDKATPEELEAYRSFVLDVAETVAKAHKEGGFLGMGGTQISDAERTALQEIAGALGVTYGA